jgi:D-cysteine desulfhydrase
MRSASLSSRPERSAGLIGLVRRGELKRGERVLFVHTGGVPALYAYQNVLQS